MSRRISCNRGMPLIIYLWSCVLAMLLAPGSRAAERPNVIIIFADDLGYGDLGCYGGKNPTPNIDRMAAEGRKFTKFHVAQAVCSASRAALLTGCYPNRLGIHGALGPAVKHGLNTNEITIAEMLKARGYTTGMAGKWHLGHHAEFLPTRHGFDEFYGLPYSNDMWPHHPEKVSFPPLPLLENERVIDNDVTAEDQKALTKSYTERAVRFIEKNKNGPFFYYLAHSMPHVPLFVSKEFEGKTGKGLYADVMAEIDWSVGEVLKTLRKHGLEKNTLVLFTSDNGPWLSYGEHSGVAGKLREGKGTSWEGGVRVPCIAWWPGSIPGGTASSAMWMTIDLLPTLAGITKAQFPQLKLDGRDVRDWAMGKTGAGNPQRAYFIYYEVNQLQAVISGDGKWKLVLPHRYRTLAGRTGGKGGMPAKYEHRQISEGELFDLDADPHETENLAKKHPDGVERLMKLAAEAREDLGDSLVSRKGTGLRKAGLVK